MEGGGDAVEAGKALLSWLSKGVTDTPVAQDRTSWAAQIQTGVRSTIGPWTVSALDDALRYAVETSERVGEEWIIDPRFVLAYPWDVGKLDDARRLLAEGSEADPIWVTGVRVPGLPLLFRVTDGMHRTVAARLAPRPGIRAKVSSVETFAPDFVEIYRGRGLIFTRPEPRVSQLAKPSPEAASILRSLGVRDWVSPTLRMWRRLFG